MEVSELTIICQMEMSEDIFFGISGPGNCFQCLDIFLPFFFLSRAGGSRVCKNGE